MAISPLKHRRYAIRSLLKDGSYTVGAALEGRLVNPTQNRRPAILFSVKGPNYEDCVAHVRDWLDARDADFAAARRTEENIEFPIPMIEEYIEAFMQVELSLKERKMLLAHAMAAGQEMTADELAAAADWSDYDTANLHYGLFAKRLGAYLGLSVTTPTTILASDKKTDGKVVWRMHDEARAAVREVFGV